MSRIKLLILLLTSFLIFNCSVTNIGTNNKNQFSLDYISGGYDGLVLKKLLQSNLKGFLLYDSSSKNIIKASIEHETEIFITNIDNTSDRERVTTNLIVNIFDEKNKCIVKRFREQLSQFYIYAPNEKFLSNERALESIKYDNTEELVKTFINSLNDQEYVCIK